MQKVFKNILFISWAIVLTLSITISACAIDTNCFDIEDQNNTNEEIIDELVEIDEDIIDQANTSITINNVECEEYVSNLDELYGEDIFSLTNISCEEVAISVLNPYIQEYLNSDVNTNNIILSDRILLLDANNHVVDIGFNYNYEDNLFGYITIGTHTKTTLVKEIACNQLLPEQYEEMYYLSNGEFYYLKDDNYYTLNNQKIPMDEFEDFLKGRRENLYNLTLNLLNKIELETISQLNNIIYIEKTDYENTYLGQTKYKGQSGEGYGGIDNCVTYLKDRYEGTIKRTAYKSLTMANFKQSSLESGAANCSLTAITRILYYYRSKGYTKIDKSYSNIYKKVKSVATKHGYTKKGGTKFYKINNIVDDVLREYGYKECKCSSVYAWTFNSEVKKEIDSNRPVIMNIARGYYGDHSVTVCGYGIYTSTKKVLGINRTKTHNMVQVYDGWTTSKRYIDYEAFAYDLISAGFGSFTKITMKR